MKLVFATNNSHKLTEVRHILGKNIEIISLDDIGCHENIPETGLTIEENASQKSAFVWNRYLQDCFADDTGLEIEALNGKPGVHSSRYAGNHCSFEDNIRKVLAEMKDVTNRRARFRTVISLILKGQEHFFEGIIEGTILHEKRGKSGFGYDPVFLPAGQTKTMAEMTMQEKNQLSHRAVAVRKMKEFFARGQK